jgi:hypothetical protein
MSGGSARVVTLYKNDDRVRLEVSPAAFANAGVDPAEHEPITRTRGGIRDRFHITIGAAGARKLGDITGLGQNPRRWPEELPDEAADLVARAVPHASLRVRTLRARGERVPTMVYSDDMARARGEDAATDRERYDASAESSPGYSPP